MARRCARPRSTPSTPSPRRSPAPPLRRCSPTLWCRPAWYTDAPFAGAHLLEGARRWRRRSEPSYRVPTAEAAEVALDDFKAGEAAREGLSAFVGTLPPDPLPPKYMASAQGRVPIHFRGRPPRFLCGGENRPTASQGPLQRSAQLLAAEQERRPAFLPPRQRLNRPVSSRQPRKTAARRHAAGGATMNDDQIGYWIDCAFGRCGSAVRGRLRRWAGRQDALWRLAGTA